MTWPLPTTRLKWYFPVDPLVRTNLPATPPPG
jgi:hypothetical protein